MAYFGRMAGPMRTAAPTERAHPTLYEINTWAWLEELSAAYRRTITLGTVPDKEWDALEALGFDFIWLMGVWKRSPVARQISRTNESLFPSYADALPGWKQTDVVGSPYAVQSYRPGPRIGSWEQIDRVRKKLLARHMGLILDFVPNHTAPDHPWVTKHPDYFITVGREDYQKDPAAFFPAKSNGRSCYVARGRDPYFPPWPDTAQLNYFHQPTREAMVDELRKIAAHCDGVRCDMAMLLLNDVFAHTWQRYVSQDDRPEREFWSDAAAAAPGFLLIAEVYWDLEWQLQQLGFHYTYDKRLYDRLRGESAREVYLHLTAELSFQNRLVRFLENHDEPRSAAVFGADHLPALACLIATLPGMRFYHHGQLDGRTRRMPVELATAERETPNPEIRSLYETLLRLTRKDVFHRGTWRLLEVRSEGDHTFEHLIAYQWRLGKAWKLVVVNLSAGTTHGRVPLDAEVQASDRYVFLDELSDEAYDRDGEDLAHKGLYVRLEPYRAHLFNVSRGR